MKSGFFLRTMAYNFEVVNTYNHLNNFIHAWQKYIMECIHISLHACKYVVYIPIKAVAGIYGSDQYKMASRDHLTVLFCINWPLTRRLPNIKSNFWHLEASFASCFSFCLFRFCAPLAFFHIILYHWVSPENQKTWKEAYLNIFLPIGKFGFRQIL